MDRYVSAERGPGRGKGEKRQQKGFCRSVPEVILTHLRSASRNTAKTLVGIQLPLLQLEV
jgi:hypothetical protein